MEYQAFKDLACSRIAVEQDLQVISTFEHSCRTLVDCESKYLILVRQRKILLRRENTTAIDQLITSVKLH